MDAPPLSPGVNAIVSCWFPAVADNAVGAEGVVDGVPVTVADAVPTPFAFTAFNCTLYEVPLVNPVIVTEETAPVAGLKAVNVEPLSVEYW